MRKLHQIIEQHWQQPNPVLSVLLRPLSRLFQTASAIRRDLYRAGRLKSEKLPVPVVVVGNIHAGGAGKTPVVSALVKGLQARGIKAGIVSRGYGRAGSGIYVLQPDSTAAEAGDEPLLLHRQTDVPVAVGSRRAEAGRALLAAHPDIKLIIADDGLQHYALQRDLEIVVFPAADAGRNNLDLLPNGGLREPLSRLKTADAVVLGGSTGAENAAHLHENIFHSRLQTGRIHRLNCQGEYLDTSRLKYLRVAAVAGIAKPERFFNTLRGLGIALAETRALPDHAVLSAADLPQADVVLITEKDAVKLSDGRWQNVWVLPVCAIIDPDLAAFVAGRLKI
ncbi:MULTISPECIES: tetraacyldisaccharide 4'-kinase [unclassified Neisseria]|uniref:tetraacyldisaccharide 4'-kinase n=1 Tax=unclassified Neisseria TaxID=2623750 RepID=UPI0010726A9A|nr:MULTISPECIES: tetraacyldisaccharide 4'-kinase [unclassified Neisseria]MBF0804637.1 tetraacyldisaccharide 4'-kinase [Neisseria sp. 19428wB4_WF04]TFU40339.1 tetraacyldisaccharide 4'-kinase [Neisseria sp. WF04]